MMTEGQCKEIAMKARSKTNQNIREKEKEKSGERRTHYNHASIARRLFLNCAQQSLQNQQFRSIGQEKIRDGRRGGGNMLVIVCGRSRRDRGGRLFLVTARNIQAKSRKSRRIRRGELSERSLKQKPRRNKSKMKNKNQKLRQKRGERGREGANLSHQRIRRTQSLTGQSGRGRRRSCRTITTIATATAQHLGVEQKRMRADLAKGVQTLQSGAGGGGGST